MKNRTYGECSKIDYTERLNANAYTSRIQSIVNEAKMEGLAVGVSTEGNLYVCNTAVKANSVKELPIDVYSEVRL